MIIKPRTVVIIAPTITPPQETYRACFTAHLRRQFVPEIICAGEEIAPKEPLIDLRDGLRLAMQQTEQSFEGRNDLQYAVFVLPTAMQRVANPPPDMPPFPIIMITIRSWQRTEWAVAYPGESKVPRLVVEEVASSITTVMTERNSIDSFDPEEQADIARLIDGIRKGIDGAVIASAPSSGPVILSS